jgi:pimeloyl-ACP methyl ester carboxylesterase
MVHWDRRGAGKSWSARQPLDSLTVKRNLADLLELTAYLRERLGRDRIYLLAHSWGTYLGLLAVRERPEWYHAYLGMGQLTPDRAKAREVQRREVIVRARQQGNVALADELESSGRRPTESEVFRVHGGLANSTSLWPLLRTGLAAPEYTLLDAVNVARGSRLLERAISDDTAAPPFPQAGDSLHVPLVLLLGRNDLTTPSRLAAEYVESLLAPWKEVYWFEEAAHFPFFEQPDRLHELLLRVDSLRRARLRAHDATSRRP